MLPAPVGKVAAIAVVVTWMSIIEVGVRLMALPRLGRLVGATVSMSDAAPIPTGSTAQLNRREVVYLQALTTVASHWPFADGPCLRQALVGGYILRRLHPRLRLGVARQDTDMVAHAWLEIDGLGTIGWNGAYLPLHGHESR
jgi:hypothetical protein